MMRLFDQEYAVERYGDEREAAGMAQGMAQGVAQGEIRKAREMAQSLAGMGLSLDKIAEAAKVSVKQVQEWLSGSTDIAR